MEIQGTTRRLIEPPGYHITPKYDLKHFRRKTQESNEKDYDVVLPLTSMIDMFSMLVIFLLLNFSATGEAYFVNKDLKLPYAENARKIESLALISITQDTVSLDSDVVGYNPSTYTLKDAAMPGLIASLQQLKRLQSNFASAGIKTKKQINIQADQNTPVVYIKRVMNVLIQEGFTGINFAVRDITERN